jgi:hypothetical protein
VLERRRHEGHKFKDSLGYLRRPCLKKKSKRNYLSEVLSGLLF